MSEAPGPVSGSVAPALGSTPRRDDASAPMRRGGLRWGVALVAVAVAVGSLGALGTLVSTPTPPDAITYIPAGSLAVLEVRPDLPGDQRDVLGALLFRIPGFSDVAGLNERVNAALDDAVRRATDGSRTWSSDVRPYAAGAALLALLPPVDVASAGSPPRELTVLTTESSPGCGPLEAGRQIGIERYRETDIRVAALTSSPSLAPSPVPSGAPSGRAAMARVRVATACAVSGRFVLLGDPSAVRAALDARAQGRNVSGDNGYGAAFRTLPEAHAAWGYLNARAVAAVAGSLPLPSGLLPDGVAMPSFARPSAGAMAVDLPDWAAMEIRFTAAGAIVDAAMPDRRAAMLARLPAAGGAVRTPVPAASSALAPALPAATIALLEAHDVATLLDVLGAQAGSPSIGASPLASLGPALVGLLGSPGTGAGLLGGAGQAGAALVASGGDMAAGVVIEVDDPTRTAALLDQVRLLGGLLGGVTSSDYKGSRILSVPVATLTGLASALSAGSAGRGNAGGPGRLGPVSSSRSSASPTATILGSGPAGPIVLDPLAAGQVVSIVLQGRLLVVGLGDGLVRAVIDTAPGASLADQTGYRSAVSAAGTPNLGSLYLDLAALRAATSRMGPTASAAPRASANPFTQAVGTAAGSLTSADGLLRGRVVITVK